MITQIYFRISSMPKNMGDSDNTTTVDNTRIHIFNEYHKNNFKFFVEDTTAEYVE